MYSSSSPSQSAPPPPGDAPARVNDDLCGGKDSTDNSISCSEDVETTEAPASVSTQRPDMFSTVVVKHATTVTDWVKMGIPLAITKKYLNDPTAGGKCDHECLMNIPTADSMAAKADAVSAAEAANAAKDAVSEAVNEAKAAAVSAAETISAVSAAAAKGAPTAALNEAKAAAVAEAEKATAADRDSACSRLPEGETADYC